MFAMAAESKIFLYPYTVVPAERLVVGAAVRSERVTMQILP